ncbi:UDP-N-acetylglucosamine 1-carboxyvinyltransferase [Anaerosporobacter faecicola]|uniref:UDP-N-acetylglucosamine 1-carboxyvinyltransferase n=1 Tax=Anaerosporobacter faecicola TaxID=2718714 RepID=UPI00143B8FC1|nr:UDP-N-acetylglucosamine 1-carboxyvinyltransferase [Anaerosporobacter faecicola]
MTYIQVTGGKKLHGDIEIQGSKNAVLPILAASLLHNGVTTIHHCPIISDVECMIRILECIGCKVKKEHSTLIVDASQLNSYRIPDEYVSRMRSSIILLGPLLGRQHFVTISYPGGCTIGARPIDLHVKGLRRLNVDIVEANELLTCMTTKLQGNEVNLSFPSVGATENILLAAVLAEGTTCINNVAKEPEIEELCRFLQNMGAKIKGIGTDTLVVEGVKQADLHDSEFTVKADRIVTGTYMAAVAATGGKVFLRGAVKEHMEEVIQVVDQMGCITKATPEGILINQKARPNAYDLLRTKPYPGFPTDLQSPFMAALSIAKGNSILIENIFEARYKVVKELLAMGANIEIDGKVAIVRGVNALKGAAVRSYELRGGAALVIAGLVAKGVTNIHSISYIQRGYEDICGDLQKLGANILYRQEEADQE